MKRFLLLTAVFAAAGTAFVAVTLPPAHRVLPTSSSDGTVPGILHVHTLRSDGRGTPDEIAAAAARAGLTFVVFTDHGDATRTPDAPVYRSGVLCLDAVEISTTGGHYIAVDMPSAPYPIGGEARDVIEDVHRLGGFSIAAHPVSPKPALRWNEWTAPFDGLEWLNGDSEWRDEAPLTLARVLFTYPWRDAGSLALLLDRSELAMRRWDVLLSRRRVVALAAADAHGRVGFPADEPLQGRFSAPIPGYAPVFRTFSIAVPDVALSGNADADAKALVNEIRQGHVFSIVDAVAAPAAFAFSATSGRQHAVAGEPLTIDGPVVLQIDVHGPPDARVSIMKNGERVHSQSGARIEYKAPAEAAIYRVEVDVPGAPGSPAVPWIVSNPIYVGRTADVATIPPRPRATRSVPLQGSMQNWTVEHSPESQGAIDLTATAAGVQRQALFRYALSGLQSAGPYSGFVVPVENGLAEYDRMTFRIRSDRPMRISVQVRVPGAGDGERWHRSVVVDLTVREVSVFFDEMTSSGPTRVPSPSLQDIRSMLFVVDTVNARVGDSGQFAVENLRLER